MSSYVYVLGSKDYKGIVKIGKANCIHSRIFELNKETGNPFLLELLYFKVCANEMDSYTTEKEIHKLLDEHWFNKEFFHFNTYVKNFIEKNFYPADYLHRISLIKKDRIEFTQNVKQLALMKIKSIQTSNITTIHEKFHKRFIILYIDATYTFYASINLDKTNLWASKRALESIATSLNTFDFLEEVIKGSDLKVLKLKNYIPDLEMNDNYNFSNIFKLKTGSKFLDYKINKTSWYCFLESENINQGLQILHQCLEEYFSLPNRSNHFLHQYISGKVSLEPLVIDLAYSEQKRISFTNGTISSEMN